MRENPYILTNEDIEAINWFIKVGGKGASILMDTSNFEVGISGNRNNMLPDAYGSGDTLAAAIYEAIGKPKGEKEEKSITYIDPERAKQIIAEIDYVLTFGMGPSENEVERTT